ncbi:phosphodiester glycosidase family protein [Deinococcus sp. Arct2-2]|uniref:phosphodiester glycosidase family protein n=1 Tax=Deinococcus sp. Arct2-2 TaxID=2568653 RepID=UPI001F0F4378|nr:phosphodiester glycosidase family protein [Deinococcus sp. Arct2-2]
MNRPGKMMQMGIVGAVLLGLSSCSRADALSVQRVTSGGMMYTVAVVNLAQDRLQLHWKNPATGGPYQTFDAVQKRLAGQGQKMLFATNSGIYAPGPRPLGLHVQSGNTLVGLNNARSGGNFALLPNGVFWVKGTRAGVTETQAFRRLNVAPTYATQSGPLLVSGGKLHPEFNRSGTSFKTRSGVGVCSDGRVRFVISAGPVNFYSFAIFFRDALKCPDALYLDGSISAYATPDTNTQLAEFGGIWTVSR